MCAAIHAVTNGLIEYFVYTTLMYAQPFAVYMRDNSYTETEALKLSLQLLQERLTNLEAVLVQLVHYVNPGEEE